MVQKVRAPSDFEGLLASVREEAEVARALLGLSSALAQVRSVEETLELAVRLAPKLLGGQRGFAARWDPVLQRFTVLAHAGFDPAGVALLEELAASPRGLPVLHHALIEVGDVHLVPDVVADVRIGPDQARRRRVGAIVAIPLVHRGEQFDALSVEFELSQSFGTREEALARGIAAQVANAFATARQFRLLRELRTFGLNVGRVPRLRAVVAETARGAARLLQGDAAAVYLYDPAQRVLSRAHVSGAAGEAAPVRVDPDEGPWRELLAGNVVLLSTTGAPITFGAEVPIAIVGAPVFTSDGALAGAIVVLFDRSISLGADEAEAFTVLGSQSSLALENAQRFERQVRVARSLQEGLLAIETPPLAGYRIDAVYEAASSESEIGGDFFDVFDLGEGRIGIVVGDVSGKGAEAAAQTAQAKYMLRAFAIRNPSPASVLFHLNTALASGLAEDRFATCMFGVFDTKTGGGQLALAGHPAPMICRRDGTVETYELSGTILGAFEGQQFEQGPFHLGPGDVLLAYTDGLTEARRDKELFGVERVREELVRCVSDPECNVAQRLYEQAQAFGDVSDDTVVFALRTDPGEGR